MLISKLYKGAGYISPSVKAHDLCFDIAIGSLKEMQTLSL